MARKWNLALMSYKEIGAIPKDRAVLMVPIGCVEQHGPAGYTGADTFLADYLCRRTAEGLEDVYVAPPLWYGYTPYTAFPGTVTLRLATLEALVRDVVGGYVVHGFRHIIIVNNHGPNEAAIEPVAAEMRRQHGIVISILYPWRLAEHFGREIIPNAAHVFGHGGEPTISVMLALHPEAITIDGHGERRGYVRDAGPISASSYRTAAFQGFSIGLFSEAAEVLPSGASGDWTAASAERGGEVLDRMVAYAREFVPAFLRFSQGRQSAAGSSSAVRERRDVRPGRSE
ncbi:MAG TPA: creatininase family protein [bacterium]|nr:creatininase family protein [bacterium]